MLSFVYDPKREIIDFVMSARIFVFMMLFSFQYVFGEEIDSESKIKFPYFYYHFSECKNDQLLIDSLSSFYDDYSIDQKKHVVDFVIDSMMTKGSSFLIENFFSQKVGRSLTKQQKDKLMERTLKYGTPGLLTYWIDLRDESYILPLHNWWANNKESELRPNFEYALIRLGDIELLDNWLKNLEITPMNSDTLDLEYLLCFQRLNIYNFDKKLYDRLLSIMLKYPDIIMRTDYSYSGRRFVYEPLSMFFYRTLSPNLKGAPKFDKKMKSDNIYRKMDLIIIIFLRNTNKNV